MGGVSRCGVCTACLKPKSRRPCKTPVDERRRQQSSSGLPPPPTGVPPTTPAPTSPPPPPPSADEVPAVGFEIRLYGEHSIQRRESDNFVSATSMAAVFKKFWKDYFNTQRAKDYISALSESLMCASNGTNVLLGTAPILIDCRRGGNHCGTWIHPRLAIDFARWLNPKFAVWLDGWIILSMLPGHNNQHPTELLQQPRLAIKPIEFHAPPETRGTGGVRPHLYVGIAPNLQVVKIGNTNNLQKRQSQHRTKRSDDASTFHDKDYHHILTSEGYGHLDQLLLEMYNERRIVHTDDRSQRIVQTDRLRNTDIDVDVIIAVLPQLQEKWEAANPVQDDEHARGIKRRRDESDVLLHESRNAAEGTKAQAEAGEAQAVSILALAEANKAQAEASILQTEADAIKAVTDSLVKGSLDDAREKLKIFEQLYRSGSRCV